MGFKKELLLLVFIILVLGMLYLSCYKYLTFENLRQHHLLLLQWKSKHFFLTVYLYILFFTLLATVSFPGGILLMTLLGGFLFGAQWGGLYALLSIILGASTLFAIDGGSGTAHFACHL